MLKILPNIIAILALLIIPSFNVLINIVISNKNDENVYRKRDIIINNFYPPVIFFYFAFMFLISIHAELGNSDYAIFFGFMLCIIIFCILLINLFSIKNIILYLFEKKTSIKPFTYIIIIINFTISIINCINDLILSSIFFEELVFYPILLTPLAPIGLVVIILNYAFAIYFYKILRKETKKIRLKKNKI